MNTETNITSLSYTNKDFNSIYSELLEYAKKLSYKWDPTSSDESDPAVVLLKLAAIIGDKDNYNIDKNILELMPASVTQLPAARQIFEQCGYSMQYYLSAEGLVNVTIKDNMGDGIDDSIEYDYTVPRFTMFSDIDNNVIYTSTEPRTIPLRTETAVPVIEGTITNYSVNNDTLITTQNLDSRNRLYFTESNIAQNGIFITNISSETANYSNYDEWVCVENIQTQPKGTRCYRFGITIDNSICYIEFPEDIELLIGEGLNIKYILTSGANGNVSSNKLKQLYVDTKLTRIPNKPTVEIVSVDAKADNIYIRNPLSITNGKDPESIDDAYKNYKRVRDTFDTLVSLKDYSDYLVTSKNASNGFVCDRTNDIQHAYKLLATSEDTSYVKNIIEEAPNGTFTKHDDNYVEVTAPVMTAFDLCIYALEYVPTVNSSETFKTTFKIFDMNKYQNDKGIYFADEVKSIQHNYIDFDSERILMLKNKYPVKASIVPRQPLSQIEKMQVLSNVENALFEALNSKQIYFGDKISAELIQKTILYSDERIKTLIDFSSPRYETYAVYMTPEKEFKELRIDSESPDGGFYEVSVKRSTFENEKESLYVRNPSGEFVSASSLSYDSSFTYYKEDAALRSLWKRFRTEIFAKNVLAGVTPIYTDANVYSVGVNQTDIHEFGPVVRLDTNTDIVFRRSDALNDVWESSKLRKNENILLTAPNYIKENNFSSYVKVLYYLPGLNSDILLADSIYELRDDDFIIFFWKDSDVSENYSYIKYDSSDNSPAKYISPTGFNLSGVQDLTSTKHYDEKLISYESIIQHYASLASGKGLTSSITYPTTPFVEGFNYNETSFISDCLKSDSKTQVLTGTRIINTLNVNEVHVNNKTNGSKYFYWILNNVTTAGVYRLFDSNRNEYTLQSGEYFMYTNDEKSVLQVVGEGTVIKRSSSFIETDPDWSVEPVSYDDIANYGLDVLENKWYTVSKIDKTKFDNKVKGGIWTLEQQQVLVGPDNYVRLSYIGPDEAPDNEFIINSEIHDLNDYDISYVDSANNINRVPLLHVTTSGWQGSSILNLSLSPEVPQVIEENQTISIYESYDSDEKTVIKTEDEPIFLLCSTEIESLGGSNIVVGDLFKSSISMISYKASNLSQYDSVYDVNTTVTKQLLKGQTFDVEFQLLSGNYLLQILSSEPLKKLTIETDLEDIYAINDTTYRIELNQIKSFKLKIVPEFEGERATITIPSLFKYTKDVLSTFDNTTYDNTTFEEGLLETISLLDVNKEFNYAYNPKNPIKNPLIAEEFLNKSHVFNNYTICEWDTVMSLRNLNNIVVHDVVR